MAIHLYGTSNNGTFVFDHHDRIYDRHSGFGTHLHLLMLHLQGHRELVTVNARYIPAVGVLLAQHLLKEELMMHQESR